MFILYSSRKSSMRDIRFFIWRERGTEGLNSTGLRSDIWKAFIDWLVSQGTFAKST